MKKLSLSICNRLKSGGFIVLELSPSTTVNRRWMAIYPYAENPVQKNIPKHEYSIYDFEVNVDKLEDYFSPNDIVKEKRHYVNSEDELFLKLDELNVNPSLFTYPWKCDYPL